MRVVDLTDATGRAEAEVVVAPAVELLLSMAAVLDHEERPTYDLGADRLAALEAAPPEAARERLHRLTGGFEKVPLHLVGLALEAPPPRDVPALLDHLRDAEPTAVLLHLLGYHTSGMRPAAPEVVEAAAVGDPDARDRLLQEVAASGAEPWAQAVAALLDLGAEQARELTAAVLDDWDRAVFQQLADEAVPVLHRDAEAKRQLLDELPVDQAVERATNGYRLTPDAATRRLVLLPSYVFRPWVFVTELGDTKIVCYPVADDSLELDPAVPSPQLVKLAKALADEGRLRLLRRLGGGPLRLAEAAEELDVSKPTAHHHLAILRQAGLVVVEEEGRDTVYRLRGEPAETAARQLRGYLGRG